MKTMNLIINGSSENVQIERYFRALGHQYLIYSKDGADIDGNVRINVVKIENNKVVPIEEAEEWDAVKKVIVEIVNDNRELNKLSIEDLDYQTLENLNVTDTKALRLPSAVMPYLSANQPEFNSLELQEQKLDEKVEALKDMNQDLANMMDEVGKEFSSASKQEHEEKAEEKMSATMEIIMPSKQVITESKDIKAVPKEKGHFNLKNLFGKKKAKPEVEPVTPEEEIKAGPEKELEKVLETPIAEKAEQINAEATESLQEETIKTESQPNISVEVSNEIPSEPTVEEPKSGFEFFDTVSTPITPEPVVVTPTVELSNEIPDVPNEQINVNEEPMEILELEEDKYKSLYEEEQNKVAVLEAQVQALNGNIKRLEETLVQYQQKLNQVKSIVD